MPVGHDPLANYQAQPRAGADALGGEEWLKDSRLNLRGNSGPIVRDLHDNLIAVQNCADGNCAGAVESAHCVVDQIGPNLIELAPVRHDPRQSAIEDAVDSDSLEL